MSTQRVKRFKKEVIEQVEKTSPNRHALAKLRALEHHKCKHKLSILVPCIYCYRELGDAEYKRSRNRLVHDLMYENGLERAKRKVNEKAR